VRAKGSSIARILGLAFLIGTIGTVWAEDAKPPFPPVMAPIAEYLEASASAEIALARSAAPPSISGDASVLVLGKDGYDTAAKGKNGFVCLVWRAWAGPGGFDAPDFWDPKYRAPICFNPAGARSVVPAYLERTKWALAGISKAEMRDRTIAAIASNRMATPDPSTLAFMMSKGDGQGHLNHWQPHVMLFLAHTVAADLGAGLKGVPLIAFPGAPEPVTVFDVFVPVYSDGTPVSAEKH